MKKSSFILPAVCLISLVAICGWKPASAWGSVKVSLFEPQRTEFYRGGSIRISITSDASLEGGRISLSAETEGTASVVWESENDRPTHLIRLSTARLRIGQYNLTAVVTKDGRSESSEPMEIGINLPIRDQFPIFTFHLPKTNVGGSLDAMKSLVDRYKQGGYNQFYFFDRNSGEISGRGDNEKLIDFLNYCTKNSMGLVPMTNAFLYTFLDDDACSMAASGNFPSTYVFAGSSKRMTSLRHPRNISYIKDWMSEYLIFAKQWPCIRAIDIEDEPTASFYNVLGAGRVDKAPEGEKWWGNGDYNAYNVSLFDKQYGRKPPRYASAKELHKKYPAGSVVSHKDPWFQWMEFTGRTFGDYYSKLVPRVKEIAPGLPVFTQPFLGLAGTFWGIENQSFHRHLDRINFHYIAAGHPVESPAAVAILGHSIDGNKPILSMIHTANFSPVSTPEVNVFNSAYVMQQFWSCIGVGVKGIGDQGEFDISQRKDTWEHWTAATRDVKDLAPLLLKANRPKSPVAILYSVESEWMQSAYVDHPLEIWRQSHTFDLVQSALQRANIPYDVVSTLDLAKNPKMLDGYQATICAAMDYALDTTFRAMKTAKTKFYITPQSALKVPQAQVMNYNFDEVYRLFKDAAVRDPRTYDHIIDERAVYLRKLIGIPRKMDSMSADTIVYVLDAPGCKLVTPVNCSLNWMFETEPDADAMAKVRKIVGAGFKLPKGPIFGKETTAEVITASGEHAYDLRAHRELPLKKIGRTISFSSQLDAGEGTIVAVTPTAIANLDVKVTLKGFDVKAYDQNKKPLSWALPVKIEVMEPDGKINSYYSSSQLVQRGLYRGVLDWAVNDPLGEWKVRVTELASGKMIERIINRK